MKMETNKLKSAFDNLVVLIKSVVEERKSKGLANADMVLMQRWKAIGPLELPTGVSITSAQKQYFEKPDWNRASFPISEEVCKSSQFRSFRDLVPFESGKNLEHNFSVLIGTITIKCLAQEYFNPNELLANFLKSINNGPVPGWCDIEVYGVQLEGIKNITFAIDDRRFTFRQFSVADFEVEESLDNLLGTSGFNMTHPDSFLRIEMNTWNPHELQVEALKATAILRLFRVCSAKFGRQTYDAASLYMPLKGTLHPREKHLDSGHNVTITSKTVEQLRRFWVLVESKLPRELHDSMNQDITPISIAYERYCDSLQTNRPVERKISYAIMGLEAIYLGEKQTQELMYRLKLGVSKALSKLGLKIKDIQTHLKLGYEVRSRFVHGGGLSEGEKRKYEVKGISLGVLAFTLLDYLRISILHLIISRQSKKDFLTLLEESFVDGSRDNELQLLMASEKAILCIDDISLTNGQ